MAANSTLSLPLTTGIPGLNMSENTTSPESGEHEHSITIAVKVILGLVLVPIQLTAFSNNLLVISAILTDTVLSERKSYLFLMSLASADFLLSVVVLPFAVISDIHGSWVFGINYCLVWMTLDIMCVTASILNLCLVSVDRYMLIAWHMYYNTHVTKGRVKIVICVVWLIAFIIAFAPPALRKYVPEEEHKCMLKTSFTYAIVSSMFSFYIPCIIILIVYADIYVIARSHASQISQFHFHLKHSNDYKPSKAISRGNRTLGILLGIFLFCWLPFFFAYPISAYLDYQVPKALLEVCKWLGYSHSCANPIIYSRFNHEIREAFSRKLHFYRQSMAEMSTTAAAPAGFTTRDGKRKSYRPDVLLSASDVTVPSSCNTWASSVPAQLAEPNPVHSQETLERSFSSLQTMTTWFHSQLNKHSSPQSLRAQSVFVHPRQKTPTSFESMHVLHVSFQSQRTVPASVQCEQKASTSVKSQQTPSSLRGQSSPSALSSHASSLHASALSVTEWQMLTISPSPPPPASQMPVSSSATCQLNPSPPPPPPPLAL